MTTDSAPARRFVFRSVRGPAALSFTIEPGQILTVGRGGAGWAVDVAIPSVAVSRQHIRVKSDGAVCSIQELRTRGGVPILRAADKAKLSPEQLAEAVSGFRAWPWQPLPPEAWQPLAEGDLVALPGWCFEVACLPDESLAAEPGGQR